MRSVITFSLATMGKGNKFLQTCWFKGIRVIASSEKYPSSFDPLFYHALSYCPEGAVVAMGSPYSPEMRVFIRNEVYFASPVYTMPVAVMYCPKGAVVAMGSPIFTRIEGIYQK